MTAKAICLIVVLAVFLGSVVPMPAALGPTSTAAPVSAAGTDRYVASSGSDTTSDGSQRNPWQTIQYAVDHSNAGDTINVAAGTYAGAIIAKDVVVVGATDGGSIIATGVDYDIGSGLKTGFRLDSTADGTAIRNFTVNCSPASSFYFGVFARGADAVVVDSLTINDPVQGITNRGGSYWAITNNVVADVVTSGGGGIGICLNARSPDYLACSGNYVHNNTITSAATAPDFTCPGIVLWLDLRDTGGFPVGTEDLSGNRISGNHFIGTGAENQVGIEMGVGGLDGNPDNIEAALAMAHDNAVIGNTLDAADLGMYFYVLANLAVLDNNVLNNNNAGIHITGAISGSCFSGNSIHGNAYGLLNETGVLVNAENNWWGDNSGPGGEGPGTGDPVSTSVDYANWIEAG